MPNYLTTALGMLHLLIEIPKTNFDKWFFISRSGNLKWIFNEILKINLNKYGFEGVIYVLYNLCNDGIIISRVAMFSTKWCHPKNLVTVASISGDCITDNDLNSASAASKVIFIYKTHFWNHALKTRFLFSKSVFFYKPHFLKPPLKTRFY